MISFKKKKERKKERIASLTGEILRKDLDVLKEAMVQAKEVTAEITRKLEK